MPLVSVILPVKNGAGTIEKAVRSILNSTLRDFELIVVDDSSRDDTPAILERLKNGDDRIRLLHNPRPGIVASLQLGISHGRSEILARMDADDVSLPERLQRQFQYLHNHDVEGVGGKVRILDVSGNPVPSLRRYERWINDHLDPDSISAYRFVESPLVHPAVMARRKVFNLGYRDGPWPEDYDLWLRAMNQGFRFAKVPEAVLHWIDHPSRITRNHSRYGRDAFDNCRRMHLLAGPLRKQHRVDLWGAGRTGKPWLRWLLENGFEVRHVIEVNPRKVGQSIHGTPVLPPETMPPADGTPLVVAVGAEGARKQIREHLRPLGYVPGGDTWFVS